MAEFLTTYGTSYHIENIIIGAEKKLVLVSPYLQISKTFLERLKDTSRKNVKIKIIYGKDELKSSERASLASLSNLELLFFKNLHAKCYFNEKEMVITSMNMYEFSEKNNREMGVFITKKADYEIFNKAVNETLSIVESSEKVELKNNKKTFTSKTYARKKPFKGYCIRCNDKIQYNTNKPYCEECYSIWSSFGNYDYQENYCHSCGQEDVYSMNFPECYTCYSNNKEKITM